MSRGILLYAELTRYNSDGQYVHPVFFELAAKANELSQKLDNAPIYAILIGSGNLVKEFKEGFTENNIDTVYVAEDERLKDYSTEYYSKIAVDLVKEIEILKQRLSETEKQECYRSHSCDEGHHSDIW